METSLHHESSGSNHFPMLSTQFRMSLDGSYGSPTPDSLYDWSEPEEEEVKEVCRNFVGRGIPTQH